MKVNRALRYGGYATLVTAGVILFVAGLNLLVQRIPLRVDMTFERFYTLSEQTERVLDTLTRDVTVLQLWEAGRENPQVAELVRKYQSRSARVTAREVDPYRNPTQLSRYEQDGQPPAVGSLIVDAGGRYRVIRLEDMYEIRQDPNTGEDVPTTFVAESAITNALASVTLAKDPVVYLLRGHGEKELQAPLRARIEGSYYVVRDLTLGRLGQVPEDADIVVAVSPRQDLLPVEVVALLDYLRRQGGKLFLLTDIGADPHPNIGRLLESYGLAIRPWLVVERSGDYMLPNQPFVLLPGVGSHAITEPNRRSDFPILFPVSQPIQTLEAIRRTVTIEPLLVSSERSYAKKDLEDPSGEQGVGDPDGPFILAAAVTDTGEVGDKPNRLVVMASSHFIFPTENLGRLEENENLFLHCLAWLQDRPELLSIPPRTVVGNRYELSLSQTQFLLFGGIAVIGLPGLVFAAALVIWLRRRHR